MTDYPLCKQMGLNVKHWRDSQSYVVADDLERAIAAAPVMHGEYEKDQSISVSKWNKWASGIEPHKEDTHVARLLLVSPIQQDSIEGVLKDMVELLRNIQENNDLRKAVDRAKKLLAHIGESK